MEQPEDEPAARVGDQFVVIEEGREHRGEPSWVVRREGDGATFTMVLFPPPVGGGNMPQ